MNSKRPVENQITFPMRIFLYSKNKKTKILLTKKIKKKKRQQLFLFTKKKIIQEQINKKIFF